LSSDDEETRHEKQAALIELSRLGQQVQLSRKFTMEDALSEMHYEIDSHKGYQSATNMIGWMKQGVSFAAVVIDGANQRFGPFLDIPGWSQTMTDPENMKRFDAPLEQIYKKFFKRKSRNPMFELAWAFGGSLLMAHVGNKLSGGSAEYRNSRRGSNSSNRRRDSYRHRHQEDEMDEDDDDDDNQTYGQNQFGTPAAGTGIGPESPPDRQNRNNNATKNGKTSKRRTLGAPSVQLPTGGGGGFKMPFFFESNFMKVWLCEEEKSRIK
jgi:hypothetical protein